MTRHTSETHLRVRYAETDQMGVVYYANYLVWMEVARTDFCKTAGFNYTEMERDGYYMAVAECTCRYAAPAVYDDPVVVRTVLDRVGRRIVTFSYAIAHAETGQLLAEGRTVHVPLGPDRKPRPLPAEYVDRLARVAADAESAP